MASDTVTLSNVAEGIVALEVERRRLYAESFGISREQRALVRSFRNDMNECNRRQKIVAERLAAIEIAVERLLNPL